MNRPLLVDALHICMGGGLMILNHLLDALVASRVDFVLLKDARCPSLRREAEIAQCIVMNSSTGARHEYYKAHRQDFSTILCFGNVPPTVSMNARVVTYIHNVNLLAIPSDYPPSQKIKSTLKRLYIKHYSRNSDCWVVQTQNTENLVRRYLDSKKPIHQFPFYYIPKAMKRVPEAEPQDYSFIGDHTNAKGHEYLVEAWALLAERGLTPTLHLTVSDPAFSEVIQRATQRGAHIVNHGKVPFEQVVDIYHASKAVVYPSLNESLGLGIIEALEAGCDILGCDLDYMHSVCVPSELFAPASPSSIVEAVMRYERGQSPRSTLKIRDMVKEFVAFLSEKQYA